MLSTNFRLNVKQLLLLCHRLRLVHAISFSLSPFPLSRRLHLQGKAKKRVHLNFTKVLKAIRFSSPQDSLLEQQDRSSRIKIPTHPFQFQVPWSEMGVAALLLVPAQTTKPCLPWQQQQPLLQNSVLYESRGKRQPRSMVPVARLFGPAIFEASKLKVLFLGVDEKKHPGNRPRTYTLTHSDITAKLTLAISHTINRAQLQGWYNRLQRDEVVAEWKKVQGKMSLHVHCHISGGHFLLDFIAKLRHYIFCKELPVVLKAFVHGDGNLFSRYPELEEARVWVYFHSNLREFNRVECWGPLKEATEKGGSFVELPGEEDYNNPPRPCIDDCSCCFPTESLISWPPHFAGEEENNHLSNSLPTD